MKLVLTLVLLISFQVGSEAFGKWERAVDRKTDFILTITKTDNSDYAFFNGTLDNILIPRVSGTIGNEKVRKFITERMTSLGWKVDHDTFKTSTVQGAKSFTNIIATLNPNSCRRLVLACHYDSKNIPGFVGATDSAVPCSMIIYLAWALQDNLKSFASQTDRFSTLQLIFFDGEEAFKKWSHKDSLYGSRHLSIKWEVPPKEEKTSSSCPGKETELEKIELFVLLDLIGSENTKFCSMFWNTHDVFQQLSAIEKQLNQLGVLEKESPNEDTHYFGRECFVSMVTDDHLPFLQKGVPVLHLIPPAFPVVWHQINDDRSHLRYPTINNLNKILKLFVYKYIRRSDKNLLRRMYID